MSWLSGNSDLWDNEKAMEAVTRQEQDCKIAKLVPNGEQLAAQAVANNMTLKQREGFIRMLAMGEHHESAGSLMSKVPDVWVDVAVMSLEIEVEKRIRAFQS